MRSRQRSFDPACSSVPCLGHPDRRDRVARVRALLPLPLCLPLLIVAFAMSAPHATADSSRRFGAPRMPAPQNGSLLVEYYEGYLQDSDVDAFRRKVSARYMEGTLSRLVESDDVQARRAAVLALGLTGSFQVNAALARALRDSDAIVRRLADLALWSIWFRADSAENNATLERVSRLISKRQLEDAIELVNKLIQASPQFAEAYNQRAIAEFFLGRFRESAEDCRMTLERNPYHFGALAGLAKCQIQLEERAAAIETLRRASKLQPFNDDLKLWIASLEAGGR